MVTGINELPANMIGFRATGIVEPGVNRGFELKDTTLR